MDSLMTNPTPKLEGKPSPGGGEMNLETNKENKMENNMIGKYVIVRANVAGVHAGCVESVDYKTQTITLTNARRLWRIYTRDKSGAISDVAANGLKDGADHSIGVALPSVTIVNPPGLEIAEMTPAAWASVRDYR